MVFQDPYGSLDPRMTVAEIIGEGIDIHHLAKNKRKEMSASTIIWSLSA